MTYADLGLEVDPSGDEPRRETDQPTVEGGASETTAESWTETTWDSDGAAGPDQTSKTSPPNGASPEPATAEESDGQSSTDAPSPDEPAKPSRSWLSSLALLVGGVLVLGAAAVLANNYFGSDGGSETNETTQRFPGAIITSDSFDRDPQAGGALSPEWDKGRWGIIPGGGFLIRGPGELTSDNDSDSDEDNEDGEDSEPPSDVDTGQLIFLGGTSAKTSANIAIIGDHGIPNGGAAVRLALPVEGAGLAFGVTDLENHWSVAAGSEPNLLLVSRTVDGTRVVVERVNTEVRSGTSIAVVFAGESASIVVDDAEVASVQVDPEEMTDGGSGVIAIGDQAVGARWDDFILWATTFE